MNVSSKNELEGQKLKRLNSQSTLNKSDEINKSVNPGVFVTTKDAYSLTDGPTIFISENVEKIASFCIQQANIPSVVMDDIIQKINYNNVLNEKINTAEMELDYITEQSESNIKNDISTKHSGVKIQGRNKSTKDVRLYNRDDDTSNCKSHINKLTDEINTLRSKIKRVQLNETYVPNKTNHLRKWANEMDRQNSFTSEIEEKIVNEETETIFN